MSDRDKYGNYVNNQGVTIKITTDKSGNDHISFYDGDVDGDHSAAHVNINYDKESWTSTTHDEGHENTDHGSGGCYLTSACMQHLSTSFNDSCYELTTLRWFRDHFVSQEDRDMYYKIAPAIVDSISGLPKEQQEQIYRTIYNQIVTVCVRLIENGKYDEAYKKYRTSTLALKDRFLLSV